MRHGTTGHRYGCRCDVCVAANKAACLRRYAADKERRKLRMIQRHASDQTATLDAARNHGKYWTAPEIEQVMRADIPRKELARQLGRTLGAIMYMRQLVRSGNAPIRDEPSTVEALHDVG